MAAESPLFLLGLTSGAVVLGTGVLVGLWLARRALGGRAVDAMHVAELVRRLSPTPQLAPQAVLAEPYAGNHAARERHAQEVAAESASPALWMTDLVHANQHLQSRLAEAEKTLEQQSGELERYICAARTDALTGLPNRRAFDDELRRRYAEWQRQGQAFSVLLADVDHFKKLNDRYGHLVGDKVLVAVGRVLDEALRETDLVTRFGGEEFAVVLPSGVPSEAQQSAERVREAIAEARCEVDGQTLAVTVSCGVAVVGAGDTIELLLERADLALYASKNAGRNFVHWHDGQRCVPVTPRSPQAAVLAMLTGGSPLAGLDESGDFPQLCSELRRRLTDLTADAH